MAHAALPIDRESLRRHERHVSKQCAHSQPNKSEQSAFGVPFFSSQKLLQFLLNLCLLQMMSSQLCSVLQNLQSPVGVLAPARVAQLLLADGQSIMSKREIRVFLCYRPELCQDG